MSWISIGAGLCSVAVMAGAFGAHGLETRLDARGLELWETAARYLIYGGFGLVLLGLAQAVEPRAGIDRAGWLLAAGTGVFAGSVGALALGGPRWLGAVTPLGGLAMIAGFAWFAWVARGL